MMDKFIKSLVSFKLNKKPIAFTIVHDLPGVFGMSFDDALANWLARTSVFTAENLCEYIRSKNTGHMAYTLEQWEKNIQK